MALLAPSDLAPVAVGDALAAVSAAFGVPVAEIVGRSRLGRVVAARQTACWLLRARPKPGGLTRSFPEIGALLGGRDHSTVIYAMRRAGERAERFPDYAAALAALAGGVSAPCAPVPLPAELVAALARKAALASALDERTVRRRNRLANNDSDAVKRARGTIALGAALQAALAERVAA